MNGIGTIWDKLTAPAPAVANPLVARRLRVLAAGSLGVLALGVPATTAQLLLAPAEFMGDPWLVFASYAVIALLYAGARSTLWRLSLWAFVISGTVGMWLMLGSSASQHDLLVGSPLALLPVVFSALLHRRAALGAIAVISIGGLCYVGLRVPGVTTSTLTSFGLMLLLVGSAITGLQELARADHTDLKKRTVELQEAWNAARSAEAARGRFLATVHHELRTPLNGILGASMLLAETVETADQRELVVAVQQSGQRLHSLVEDVLAYVAEGVGELSFEQSPTWVDSVVKDIVDRHEALAAARGTTLSVVDGRPPQLLLDEARLRHVVTHLLRNAITFTEGGRVTVTTAWEDGQLTISVADTGVGMTKLQLEQAFAPLRQGDESSTRVHEGLGLGLSMSLALAKAMGGDLRASTAPGQGSTFILTLPGQQARPSAA